jgi:hypothetical protein
MAKKTKNKRYTRRSRPRPSAKRSLRLSKKQPYTPQRRKREFTVQNRFGQKIVVTGTTTTKKTSRKKLTLAQPFRTVKKQVVCKRRKQRKEIIHAVNKSGLSGQRKPNNKHRRVKC